MNLIRKNTSVLCLLISASVHCSQAMDEATKPTQETHASIIMSQNSEYCASVYADLITKNEQLAELKSAFEKAKFNFGSAKTCVETYPDNKKHKVLYIQYLEEFSQAKSTYVTYYDTLIIKFIDICSKEGFAHLTSQFIGEVIMAKEEVNPPLSEGITTPFKKAWALVDAKDSNEKAGKLFAQLAGLHPYAAQGLFLCSVGKKEKERALSESIRMKLALGNDTGLLKDIELLCRCQNTRDANLLLKAAQYYQGLFAKSKNPLMIYNALLVGTMMPKCQEGALLLNQLASQSLVSDDNNQICYLFMNFCRNQEDVQSLKVFLQNNKFEGEWFSGKDQQFFARHLEIRENDKELWSHRANLDVLKKISNSPKYPEEVRLLAAKIRFKCTEKNSFESCFDYYKILKEFNHIDRHKYIGILHVLADAYAVSRPEQLCKFATELGYFPETFPMFMKSADAGCKAALSAIESHDIFLTTTDQWELALFFARHNSIVGLRNLYKKSNNTALLVIARELEKRSQSGNTFEVTEEYLPMLDLKYEEHKAEIKLLEEHIRKLEKMIKSIKSAPLDYFDSDRIVVAYHYRPTIDESRTVKSNIERDLSTSKSSLREKQNWLNSYASKRQRLIKGMSCDNLFSLAKDNLLIYQALNVRLRDGLSKTIILKDTYFELLKTAAQHSEEANNELQTIETNGFSLPLYLLPSDAFSLEYSEEFSALKDTVKKSFICIPYFNMSTPVLNIDKPVLCIIDEQSQG